MSKKIYFNVISFIIMIMILMVGCCILNSQNNHSLVFANLSKEQANENLINENSKYFYIDNPTGLSGDATNFYATDKDLNLYNYSNNEIKSTSYKFDSVMDYKYVKSLNKIFVLTESGLEEISAVDYTLIAKSSEILGTKIDCNGVYLAIANENGILIKTEDFQTTLQYYFVDEYNTSNFNDIKDICIFNNSIYLLDCNQITSRVNLIKIDLNEDLTKSKATFVKQISYNIKNDFELNANQFGLILSEESNLKLYTFNGNLISNLLDEYTHFERSFKSGEVISPSGVVVDNDVVVIADKISNSIQSFKMVNNQLIFQKLLVASSGFDVDRLNGASDLALYGEDIVAISDSDNNRIVIHNLENHLNAEIATNSKPSLIEITNTGSLYIYSQPYLIYYENIENLENESDSNLKPTIVQLSTSASYNIVDMAISALNILYLLDTNSNSLLKFENGKKVEIVQHFGFDLNADSKILIDASGNVAFVLSGKTIHSINLESGQINQFLTNENKIIDFSLDYKSNLYALLENEDGNLIIEKFDTSANLIASKNLIGNDYINLELNINTGKFFAIDDRLQAVKEIAFDDDFTANLISFTNDTSFISKMPYNEKVTIGKICKSTLSFKYPFMISPLMQFESGFNVIVLEKSCKANENFSYCLVANKTKNNVLCYIPKDAISFDTGDIVPEFSKIKVITAYAYLYKLPTSLKFEDDSELRLDKIAYQNEEFEIIGYASNYKDFYGNSYFTIKLEDNSICYMKTFNAMNSTLDVYQETFQPNAHLSIVLDSDVIELFEMKEQVNAETGESEKVFISLGKSLENNSKVFISKNNYSTENEFTKIVYLNENDEQLSAYVKTKFVCLDREMMPHVQIGLILLPISVILIIIVAVFAYNFIKRKKKEEKLNQIENE